MKTLNRILIFSKAQVSAFIGGLVDYGTMVFFTEIFYVHYTISIVIGGIIGSIVNYSLNKHWTFRSNDSSYIHSRNKQIVRFTVVVLNSIFLKDLGTYLITKYINLDYKISRIIVDLTVSLVFNFTLQKYWVFKKKLY
jgi:putative flippase GtrA